jgi:hypothetical protein
MLVLLLRSIFFNYYFKEIHTACFRVKFEVVHVYLFVSVESIYHRFVLKYRVKSVYKEH